MLGIGDSTIPVARLRGLSLLPSGSSRARAVSRRSAIRVGAKHIQLIVHAESG